MPARAEINPLTTAATLLLMLPLACGSPATPTTSSPSTSSTTSTQPAEPTTTMAPTATTLPVVELNLGWPADGFVTVEPTLVVFGVTSIDATVTVNNEQAATGGSAESAYFEGSVTLTPGHNTINVFAESAEGSTSETTVNVRYLPDAIVEFTYFTNVAADEVVADYAQFLSGQEAIDAAVEDGVTTPEEGVPNDYYIRNVNSQLRTLPVSSESVVILSTSGSGAVGEVGVPMEDWLSLFHEDGTPYDPSQEEVPPLEEPHFGFFGAGWGAPYWITIDAGQVVQIRQQYLP